MDEHGLSVSHTTIMRWVQQYSPILNRRIRKYLNNIVEQDHRFIKRKVKPMLGFKSFKSACSTISGIEIMHMLHKNQAGKMSPFEEKEFINLLMNVG